jgi:hypothetical protein
VLPRGTESPESKDREWSLSFTALRRGLLKGLLAIRERRRLGSAIHGLDVALENAVTERDRHLESLGLGLMDRIAETPTLTGGVADFAHTLQELLVDEKRVESLIDEALSRVDMLRMAHEDNRLNWEQRIDELQDEQRLMKSGFNASQRSLKRLEHRAPTIEIESEPFDAAFTRDSLGSVKDDTQALRQEIASMKEQMQFLDSRMSTLRNDRKVALAQSGQTLRDAEHGLGEHQKDHEAIRARHGATLRDMAREFLAETESPICRELAQTARQGTTLVQDLRRERSSLSTRLGLVDPRPYRVLVFCSLVVTVFALWALIF